MLVCVDGLYVAVAPKSDAPFKLRHCVDVVHPVFVDDPQHDDTLKLTHDGNAVRVKSELLFTLVIDPLCDLVQRIAELFAVYASAEGVHA